MATKKTQEKLNLEDTLKQLEKNYGKGTIVSGNSVTSYPDVISTGSIAFDNATGIGGFPMGKVVEFIGWESSGKSTCTLEVIANAQKKGIKCLLVDGENSFDRQYAETLGVNVDNLLIYQLDGEGGEKAYNIAEQIIKTGEVGLVVFDSQNSLQPKSVMEGEVGDSAIGKHARMLNQAIPKLTNLAQEYNCLAIVISQFREKIGVMFGSPETTQGGNALRFYSQMRVEFRKTVLKDGDDPYANRTRIKVIKNKLAAPFKTAEFEIVYGKGIDKVGEIISMGVDKEVLKQRAGVITFEGEKYEEATFRELIETNDEFKNALKEKINYAGQHIGDLQEEL
jgi:recombination protein RecA